jgi:N-acetylmuramidase
MAELAAAVGKGRPNKPGDVKTVQALLNRNRLHLIPLRELKVDGTFDSVTDLSIRTFQQRVMGMATPDGIVAPKSQTHLALNAPPAARPAPSPRQQTTIGGLTEAEFVSAATRLKCETAAVKAVVKTELGVREAFDERGRPTILFERHKFYEFTAGKFAKSDPDICNKTSGGYGKFSEQYGKYERAEKLDKNAAMLSCSWGAFQIMGFNHKRAGYTSVDSFVTAMRESVKKQVSAFIAFIESDAAILKAIQKKDWATFAYRYNGEGYKSNNYDTKMATHYREFSGVNLSGSK